MIDFPYLIEPGTRTSRSSVVGNLAAIAATAKDIDADRIEDSSIELRHIGELGIYSESWKIAANYTQLVALTTAAINSNPLIVPLTAAPVKTATYIGGPVIVYARIQVSATHSANNAILRPAIYVDGLRESWVDLEIGALEHKSIKLFYMFEATETDHLIEVRADTATTTAADVEVQQAHLEVISVRV